MIQNEIQSSPLPSDFFSTVERIFHDWNYGHPKVLYGLMRALKPAVAVEVGTYRGYAACYMARAMQENNTGHLYCIDDLSLTDHMPRYGGGDPVGHLESNLTQCGIRDFVTLLRGKSTDVHWPKNVDFAYIDGWHSYLVAKSDFDNCAKRGAQVICLDDTINCVGPRKLIAELDPRDWSVITLGNDNGLSICQRVTPLRNVTFSQELPGHPGTDITNYTSKQVADHLTEASKHNGVIYKLHEISSL